MKFVCNSIKSLNDPIELLNKLVERHSTFLLIGELGAGKTTLVQKWMGTLHIKDEVSSPTFSIINHYQNEYLNIFHMDLYRLETLEEAINIGIEEYLWEDGAMSIIEWPEIIEHMIPTPYVRVEIDLNNGSRVITITETDSLENS